MGDGWPGKKKETLETAFVSVCKIDFEWKWFWLEFRIETICVSVFLFEMHVRIDFDPTQKLLDVASTQTQFSTQNHFFYIEPIMWTFTQNHVS